MIPEPVLAWLSNRGYGAVKSTRSVSGGCINNGLRLVTSGGGTFFLKTNSSLPADVFSLEAEGLRALQVPGAPRVPEPFLHGPDFLLLEDLEPGAKSADFWTVLGQQLAGLHQHTGDRFGFDQDNYIGATPQPNRWTGDGYTFFAEHRLMFQAQMAQRNGYFQSQELRLVERMCSRLPELVPAQPASLIHGDLWGGNVISDRHGRPAIIDPAVHYGWAEAELGMTALFGGFSEAFYRAYEAARPLEPGWRGRLEIYNLYHLINHLNLFGASYYAGVKAILRRYG